jgi:DNA-binding protein HU-beta
VNKQELIEILAAQHGLPKTRTRAVLDTLFSLITVTVASGGRVVCVGFGSFESTQAAARVGQNPRTGQRVRIGATRRPRFIAGRKFRNAVRMANTISHSD